VAEFLLVHFDIVQKFGHQLLEYSPPSIDVTPISVNPL
jgi:hypothetical protein